MPRKNYNIFRSPMTYKFFGEREFIILPNGEIDPRRTSIEYFLGEKLWNIKALPTPREVVNTDYPMNGRFKCNLDELLGNRKLVPFAILCLEHLLNTNRETKEDNLLLLTSFMLESVKPQNRAHAAILMVRNIIDYPSESKQLLIEKIVSHAKELDSLVLAKVLDNERVESEISEEQIIFRAAALFLTAE